MPNTYPYEHGRRHARIKLGVFGAMLGGAGIGGLAGYALAPENRKGHGVMYGAALGGLGAGLGSAVAPYMHATSDPGLLARTGVSTASTGLGTLAGIGATGAIVDKTNVPTSEDPYHYHAR